MHLIKPNWKDKIEQDCIRYADETRRMFGVRLRESSKALPSKVDQEQASFLISMYMDTFIGTLVMLAGTYGNLSKEHEESVLEGVKYKFSVLRERALSGKENMHGKATVNDEGTV